MLLSISRARVDHPQTRTYRKRENVKIKASTIAIRPVRKTRKQLLAEKKLLDALEGVKGRGQVIDEEQSKKINTVIEALEQDGGVKSPTTSQYINGTWKLLFTSKPGTESPIQRTFTGVDRFSVYQEIDLQADETPTIENCVNFGEKIGLLRVVALGSTDSRPLPDFVPRQEEGFPLFGKSLLYPPAEPDMRIDFQFDNAAFEFKFLPFKIPYPVPFRLLGDDTKGWLDTTYLSPDGLIRISRGNKGTLFVLEREQPMQDKIVQAVAKFDEQGVLDLIEELTTKGTPVNAKSDRRSRGKWRQIWSQQAEDANWLQKTLANQLNNFQIVEGDAGEGKVQNLVEILGVIKVRLDTDCSYVSQNRLQLKFNYLSLEFFGFEFPVQKRSQGEGGEDTEGYLDILYLDDDIRVSKGNRGSLFVHVREEFYVESE